ncbi:MAG: hypothetical protein J7L98_07975 [Candidatus Verstraetearchaeota archaeon]|nr:hypothetical protein [Candidatus Verstraetearchaeota archaeon]
MRKTLRDLVVKRSEVLESKLYSLLEKFVRFDVESGEAVFEEDFKELPLERKVLVLLLAQRALKLLDWTKDANLSTGEIAKRVDEPLSSVEEVLKSLVEGDLVKVDSAGRYFVELSALDAIAEFFERVMYTM